MQEQEYIVQEASVAQESTEGTHVIESEQALAAVIENLLAEEKQVQMQYENFALQAALQNEGFGNYLLQGYAMQDAYVLSHQNELMEASTSFANRNTAITNSNTIIRKGILCKNRYAKGATRKP